MLNDEIFKFINLDNDELYFIISILSLFYFRFVIVFFNYDFFLLYLIL